jgi:hypothetical protein
VRYDDFKTVWEQQVRASKLRRHGFTDETLDTKTLDRSYRVRVEPPEGQESEPFFVTATLSWEWTALQTARTATTEDDTVKELLGVDAARGTEQPQLRVDIELHATLPYGQPIAMPSGSAWAAWSREVLGRLEHIERLLPEQEFRDGAGEWPELLAWQGQPSLTVQCARDGELLLAGVSLDALVMLDLPRQWDSSEEPDEGPEGAIAAMLSRLEGSLRAWGESLDHLRPARSAA